MNQITENYSYEKIRSTRVASDQPGSFFRQYELVLTDFNRFKFVSSRLAMLLLVFLLAKLIFQSSTVIITISAIACLVVFIEINSKVYKEILLFIPNVGFQDTVYYASGRHVVSFHKRADFQDLIINEAVLLFRVIFYLCLTPASNDSDESRTTKKIENDKPYLRPLLTGLKPKLDVLKSIYNEVDKLL